MTTYNITVPPEPEGPIWDKEGDKWEREGSYWGHAGIIHYTWKELITTWDPLTDHPPYELHKRYMSNQLTNLPEGSLLSTDGPYEGVQYATRLMGKWFAWWPDGHDWVFGEAKTLDDIAASFSIHRIGWPDVPKGYEGPLSELLMIGVDK